MIKLVVGTGVSGGLTMSGRLTEKKNWTPKETHTIDLEPGEISQYELRGVVPTGEHASEIVTNTGEPNAGADHADPGADHAEPVFAGPFDTADRFGGPAELVRSLRANPAANGARQKDCHGHGGTPEAPSKQCERGKKPHLQGMVSASNGYEKGNVSKPGRGAEEARGSEIGGNEGVKKDAPVKSWSNLFSLPAKTGGPLHFHKPHCADGKIVARPSAEVVNEGIEMWKGCLVGQFLDKRLPFPVVRSLINRLWGKKEMSDISTTENGLFFFRFRDPEARDWVMDSGPWNLAGRPFILRAWKPGMDMLNIQLSSIPIWVKFYNIPLEYWTSTGLGYIASTVGIPLHLDSPTENQTKLSFARICIEVGVDCEFPKSVLLDKGDGNFSTIRVEYPWAPQCCPICKRFGHNRDNCQGQKGSSSRLAYTITGNSASMAQAEMVAGDKEDTSEAGESKKSEGDLVVISENKIGGINSVDARDAVLCAEEETSMTIVAVNQLHGNTFECLAQSEDEETGKPIETLRSDLEFSDTSPTIDTFKHMKRVDELDFSPVLSKKKLKKLKKRTLANKQDPVARGEANLPNG